MIRTTDLDRAEAFYGALGLKFDRHAHGKGPMHLSCEHNQVVFEIYPRDAGQRSEAIRIGFAVVSVDEAVTAIAALGGIIRNQPKDGPWGRRAVIEDLDCNIVELTSPTN